jgi:hypothetical protein
MEARIIATRLIYPHLRTRFMYLILMADTLASQRKWLVSLHQRAGGHAVVLASSSGRARGKNSTLFRFSVGYQVLA